MDRLEHSPSATDEANTVLTLTQSKDVTQQTITRLLLSQAYWTLGVWIVADGNQRRQLVILNVKIYKCLAAI